jgi:hypothetical protein
MTSFYDCIALTILCLFVIGILVLLILIPIAIVAAFVYAIICAAGMALKALGVIHLLAVLV